MNMSKRFLIVSLVVSVYVTTVPSQAMASISCGVGQDIVVEGDYTITGVETWRQCNSITINGNLIIPEGTMLFVDPTNNRDLTLITQNILIRGTLYLSVDATSKLTLRTESYIKAYGTAILNIYVSWDDGLNRGEITLRDRGVWNTIWGGITAWTGARIRIKSRGSIPIKFDEIGDDYKAIQMNLSSFFGPQASELSVEGVRFSGGYAGIYLYDNTVPYQNNAFHGLYIKNTSFINTKAPIVIKNTVTTLTSGVEIENNSFSGYGVDGNIAFSAISIRNTVFDAIDNRGLLIHGNNFSEFAGLTDIHAIYLNSVQAGGGIGIWGNLVHTAENGFLIRPNFSLIEEHEERCVLSIHDNILSNIGNRGVLIENETTNEYACSVDYLLDFRRNNIITFDALNVSTGLTLRDMAFEPTFDRNRVEDNSITGFRYGILLEYNVSHFYFTGNDISLGDNTIIASACIYIDYLSSPSWPGHYNEYHDNCLDINSTTSSKYIIAEPGTQYQLFSVPGCSIHNGFTEGHVFPKISWPDGMGPMPPDPFFPEFEHPGNCYQPCSL